MVYTPFIWPLICAFAILIGIALYVRRFQDVPAARSFSLTMWLMALWPLVYAFHLLIVSFPLKVLTMELLTCIQVFVLPNILIVALEYVGRTGWIKRNNLLLLWSIPILSIPLP